MGDMASTSTSIIPLISATTALAAVIIGPMVQILVAKRQQRASVVSANRVRWIEDFRREIASFIAHSHLHEVQKLYLDDANSSDDVEGIRYYHKALDDNLVQANICLHSIRMKIDMHDRVERGLWEKISRLDEMDARKFSSVDTFETAYFVLAEEIRDSTKRILRSHWRTVEQLR